MAWKLPPPGDIPTPPACSAHKYKIDVKERLVRADFSSGSNRCVWRHAVFFVCGAATGSSLRMSSLLKSSGGTDCFDWVERAGEA